MDWIAPLVTLTLMEIVLGVDNIVFLSIVLAGLPESKKKPARIVGLSLALGARIVLLLGIKWVMGLDSPIFHWSSLGFVPAEWVENHHVDAVTGRDLVLLGGGFFLIAKSVVEIHKKAGGIDDEDAPVSKSNAGSFAMVIVQIIIFDLLFSLDSVISAIGMAKQVWVMIVAMSIAVTFMALFAGAVSRFIDEHPTFKMLALSFLVLIGVLLIAEGAGSHVNKGYIYVAMIFALGVELLNMKARKARRRARG